MNPERVAKLLNTTGAFLQLWLFEALDRGPYTTAYEAPFQIEDYHGSADVVATRPIDQGRTLLFAIEAKKVNPTNKHWVFFKQKRSQDNLIPYFNQDKIEGIKPSMQFYVPTYFPRLGNNCKDDLPLHDTVYEINENWGSIYRGQQNNADKALHQVNKALSAFFNNFKSTEIFSRTLLEQLTLFIPLIVTTANLYEAQVNPQQIDPASGQVEIDKLSVQEKGVGRV